MTHSQTWGAPDSRPHFKFWPKRRPHAITIPATSLWENLAISARRYPDKAATIFFNRVLSYAQLQAAAERLAAKLQSLGVKKGDRVLVDMQNAPQLIIAHFAIFRADAAVVPINPMNRAEELKHYITDPQAAVAITTADLAGELAKASNALAPGQRLRHLIVTHFTDAFNADLQGDDAAPDIWRDWLLTRHSLPELEGGQVHAWDEAIAFTGPLAPTTAGPDDMAMLPYTSGTTGLPKGCIHPHSTIMHNAVASGVWNAASSETVTLMALPMFHVTGMISGMQAVIYMGGTMVIMPRWERNLAGRLISHWKVTNWPNIPTMVIDLLASPDFDKFDLTSLTAIGGGGAAMPQAVAQRLQDVYGLRYVEGYGLTETAAPSHSNPFENPKKQCLGIPFMSTDARIVNPETLAEAPQGQEGEIVIRGPQVFSGYWRQPEATRAAFFELEGKRFFRTGDLGRMDEDGYFFITDRLKRMINASGFKIWPAEVETLMFKHPAIAEACVIGFKDDYRGESAKAVVVLRDEARGQVTEQDIIDWCRANMAAYKAPRKVAFVDALPKSGSGKVMWRILQETETRRAAPTD